METKNDNELSLSGLKIDKKLLLDSIDKKIAAQYIYYGENIRLLGLTNVAQTECLQLQPLNNGIYDGCLGISLFKAEYSKFLGDKKSIELEKKTIAPLINLLKGLRKYEWNIFIEKYGLGIGSGIGSFIYGLSKMYNNFEIDSYLYCSEKLIDLLTYENIRTDTKNDILNGKAGLLLALLKNYSITQNKKSLDLAIECGNSLLNKQYKKGEWLTIDDSTSITGFAHGLSGIAYSLLKLYEMTGIDNFKKTARNTIIAENKFFSNKEFKWADQRKGVANKFKDAWCHGTVGIGLTRLYFDQYYPSDEMKRDIMAVRKAILEYPINSIDHICCGNFGRLEFLFQFSKHNKDDKDFRNAYDILLKRINETGLLLNQGTETIFNNPVLFKGLSGIGYQIIRFESVADSDSLLLFE